MSDDYKVLMAENERLAAMVATLEGHARALVADLAAARYEAVDLRHQLQAARKPKARTLDQNAASAFDRPYDGR